MATILFHIPSFQTWIGGCVEDALMKTLGTKVIVERVDLGFLNRIIVDGLTVYDQRGKKMLVSTRLSAKIDIIDLMEGRISISSAQLFGVKANLYKDNADAPLNCQFVIDSLASKDTTESAPINLHIASLVIRNGELNYDRNDIAPSHDNLFSPNHVAISKLSAHLMIYAITPDSIDVAVKHLTFQEASGFALSDLSMSLLSTRKHTDLKYFALKTPHSAIELNPIHLSYKCDGDSLIMSSLAFNGSTKRINISANDVQHFIGSDISALPSVSLRADIKGDTRQANGSISISTTDNSAVLSSAFTISDMQNGMPWSMKNTSIRISKPLLANLNSIVSVPDQVMALGNIGIEGNLEGTSSSIGGALAINTSEAGKAAIRGHYDKSKADAEIITNGIDLGKITKSDALGKLDCTLTADATFNDGMLRNAKADMNITSIEALNYKYQGITAKANFVPTGDKHASADFMLDADDPNLTLSGEGQVVIVNNALSGIQLTLDAERVVPGATGFTNEWGSSVFSFLLDADLQGSNINNLTGNVSLSDFTIQGAHKSLEEYTLKDNFSLSNLDISMSNEPEGLKHFILTSDFCDADIKGKFTPSTIPSSFTRLLYNYIQDIPSLEKPEKTTNNFTFNLSLNSTEFLRRMLGLNMEVDGKAVLQGYQNDILGNCNIYCNIPSLKLPGKQIDDIKMLLWTPSQSLNATISATLINDDAAPLKIDYDGKAENDVLSSTISWANLAGDTFKGKVNTLAKFIRQADGKPCVNVAIEPSNIQLGDSVMHLHSKGITYSDKHLAINHFAIENEQQHVYVNGIATTSATDSLIVDLKDINVAYIMNLVNFHSVEFGGFASGRAIATSVFDSPQAWAHLDVKDFLFEYGNLGTLHVDANLNNNDEQIDIDGYAIDAQNGRLGILGFVSPQRNCLDLDLTPKYVNLDFMHSFCSAFMKDIDARIDGRIRLFGDFSNINLEGKAVANGNFTVSSLNTRYTLKNDTVIFVPDDIKLVNQPIYDIYGHRGIVTGGLHHKHLTKMTYDFDIHTENLLCYDFREFGDNIFYGTAYLTGDCELIGRSAELTINVKGNVMPDSKVVYNASSPDAITQQEFITWNSANSKYRTGDVKAKSAKTDSEDDDKLEDVSTNIHLNFLVNVDKESLLRVIMDEAAGDYIDLNGNGTLRANYYNKGGLNLFGSFNVEKGLYRMSIQNVIRRDFEFQPGGTLSFVGEPFGAQLNLLAKYTLNSVPLSDLNIGKSFSNNNIRVDCLMNIKGTAGAPTVEFDMDLPTVNSDAKSMIYSLINSEEEMNQQVIYLLSVGRFYAQSNNNSSAEEASRNTRTNMAMQSLLSGTVSQQLGNVLGSFLNSSKWTVGANISPGNEGFDNAEYEGIVNGTLLNNRLLINGQFGYRNNALTSQQGFIGDFDIRYLLVPSGNFAVRVYNQTNDRYFTRNSLNTQGVGIILKKDFSTWRDLFRKKNN